MPFNKTEIIRFTTIAIIGVAVVLFIGQSFDSGYKKLKVYKPRELNPTLVDPSSKQEMFHKISDFNLINHSGDSISYADFEGKIFVTDFFFSTCPTICPKMGDQLLRVYEKYGQNEDFRILSHSVQPEYDSVPVLKQYSLKYNADPKVWMFATGSKKHIYELARKSYFVAPERTSKSSFDFIHTENFVLIDKQRRIRGMYDGTSEDDVDQLIEDIELLYTEYSRVKN